MTPLFKDYWMVIQVNKSFFRSGNILKAEQLKHLNIKSVYQPYLLFNR